MASTRSSAGIAVRSARTRLRRRTGRRSPPAGGELFVTCVEPLHERRSCLTPVAAGTGASLSQRTARSLLGGTSQEGVYRRAAACLPGATAGPRTTWVRRGVQWPGDRRRPDARYAWRLPRLGVDGAAASRRARRAACGARRRLGRPGAPVRRRPAGPRRLRGRPRAGRRSAGRPRRTRSRFRPPAPRPFTWPCWVARSDGVASVRTWWCPPSSTRACCTRPRRPSATARARYGSFPSTASAGSTSTRSRTPPGRAVSRSRICRARTTRSARCSPSMPSPPDARTWAFRCTSTRRRRWGGSPRRAAGTSHRQRAQVGRAGRRRCPGGTNRYALALARRRRTSGAVRAYRASRTFPPSSRPPRRWPHGAGARRRGGAPRAARRTDPARGAGGSAGRPGAWAIPNHPGGRRTW